MEIWTKTKTKQTKSQPQILHQKAEQTFLHFDICMLLYGLAVAM